MKFRWTDTQLFHFRTEYLAYMKMANPWTNRCTATSLWGEASTDRAQTLD